MLNKLNGMNPVRFGSMESQAILRGNMVLHDAFAAKLLQLAGRNPADSINVVKTLGNEYTVSPNSMRRMQDLIKVCVKRVGVQHMREMIEQYRDAIGDRELKTDGDVAMAAMLNEVISSWEQGKEKIIDDVTQVLSQEANAIVAKTDLSTERKKEQVKALLDAKTAILRCLEDVTKTDLTLTALPKGLLAKLNLPSEYLLHVTDLQLKNAGLQKVPDFVHGMRNLASLSLAGNAELGKVDLSRLPQLQKLDLALTNVSVAASQLPPSLSVLDLTFTPDHNVLKDAFILGKRQPESNAKNAGNILGKLRQMNDGMGAKVLFADDTLARLVEKELDSFPSTEDIVFKASLKQLMSGPRI
ncbi:MAG TPA: hypothetical protein VEC06_13255 [Paucimonas sp.]|nr:hypothetical protein [Paucimonas sp.]